MPRPWRRFLWYTVKYAWTGAWAAAFGWAGPIGGGVVAAMGPRLLPEISGNSWHTALWQGLFVGLASLAFVFLIFLVLVAPVRAYWRMYPLSVKVDDRLRAPGIVFNELAKGYNVNLVIQNRSDVGLLDCSVHVLNMIFQEGQQPYARFVDKFDLPPKTQRVIPVAHWFSREPPNADDIDIGIDGPVGSGFGGNRQRVPPADQVLRMTISAPVCHGVLVRCRIWVDQNARVLRGELIT